MSYDFEVIQRKVECSLNKLMEYDSFLLKENLNERTITHKLAEYLQQEFRDWNVDCEYNRDYKEYYKRIPNWNEECLRRLKNPKNDDTNSRTVFPDIIVHKRDRRDNLIVIEAKKAASAKERECDIGKLQMFINTLEYKFGFFIDFAVREKCGYNIHEVVTGTNWETIHDI